MPLTRREFLLDAAGSPLVAPFLRKSSSRIDWPFRHGVASGDPLTDRVILWTRITPADDAGYVAWRYRVAADPDFQRIVSQGEGYTDRSRDFTVKVDAEGLLPGRSWYYQFEALGHYSDIGRTRTLPETGVEHLRIAFTSCANYAVGVFNVYRELAQRVDLDVILHLGDYLYEYADLEACASSGRIHQPLTDLSTLADYRSRHACYKLDPDLQEVHRQHPFMLIWDDHEVANNAWPGGAENHQAGQGDWAERLGAAMQAYLEWMPIRDPDSPGRIWRNFRFGDLLDLNLLDTRLAGRDQQAETLEQRNQPERTLLGGEQEAWLGQQMQQAVADGMHWNLCAQQVMLGQLGTNSMPFNYDQWDGYPAARQRLFDQVRASGLENWVVLTGDIHSSWAMHLHDDPFADDPGTALGVELVTPAVTSEGISSQTQAQLAAASLEELLPHLQFVDFYYRGYVLLDIRRERLQAEWWVVDNVASRQYGSGCLRALVLESGSSRWAESQRLTPARPAADPAPGWRDDMAFWRQWRQPAPTDTLQQVATRGDAG